MPNPLQDTTGAAEPFDFEAFMAGTQLARGTVGFFRKDHRDEIGNLTARHDEIAKAQAGDRESSKSEHRKLADRIKALRAEMNASRVNMVVRTLDPDEYKAIREDDAKDVYDQLELQSVEPKLTADQWRALAKRIGYAQFAVLVEEASELVVSKVAVPDFSQSVLTTLNPPPSSPS
jgi:predicted signal transduction protein with EAL and GGDEF domain